MSSRHILLLCVGLTLSTGCQKKTTSPDSSPPVETPKTTAGPQAVVDSELPVGQKMMWLIALLNDSDEPITPELLAIHFAPLFFDQVPPQSLVTILTDARVMFGQLSPSEPLVVHPHDMTLIATTASGQKWVVALAVSRNEPHLIEGLFFQPAPRPNLPPPENFSEFDARLRELGKHPRALIARIDSKTHTCTPIHQLDAAEVTPLASTFKLYVLLALARQIEAGTISWDDPILIQDVLKSLPSGSMQNHTAGSSFPVSTYAESMISISDNTATDHLMIKLGDEALDNAVIASGHHDPFWLKPMFTTQELFKMKLLASEEQVAEYLAREGAPGRQDFRATELAALPQVTLQDALTWKGPRHTDTIEWFATTEDVCALHATFVKHADKPAYARALQIMSVQNAGIDLEQMKYVGYKGGAEPGVLTMTWLVQDKQGQWFSVALAIEGTIPGINEAELVDLGRAAVNLIEAP